MVGLPTWADIEGDKLGVLQKFAFLPASAGKAGIQGSSELLGVTLLLEQHSKAYKSSVKHSKA